ncbi:MAG: peptidylprolyl isomerase [Micrococcales bacterium]|nr:peptidylprolyl isomerase [Micrococcales bacterium]
MFATLHTSVGDVRVELFPNHAPTTVANFTGLAAGTKPWQDPATGAERTDSLYAGTLFHRVIAGFMIQGGDPLGTGRGGPGYTFDDEIHPELAFTRPYLLAMANSGQRPDASGRPRGTNGSQFFVTVGATPWLNGKHTIFGEVADDASRAVVDAIATTPTGAQDRPLTDVVVASVSLEP